MGSASSTPAPLLELDTVQGKVFIPSSFTIKPPPAKPIPPRHPPIYTSCYPPLSSPLSAAVPPPPTYRRQPRPHPHFQPHTYGAPDRRGLARRGGVGLESSVTNTSDASTLADIGMPSRCPRVTRMEMGGQTANAYSCGAGGMRGGDDDDGYTGRMGVMGSGGMGRRRGHVNQGLDESGARPRSAPEMMRGGAGGGGIGYVGGGPGMMGGMMRPPPGGMPPAYTSHPSIPQLSHGAMNPYPIDGFSGPSPGPGPALAPAPGSTSSSSTPPPAHATWRNSGRRYEHVPMGAYASTEKPRRQRPRAEPQTSARLNKGQPSDKKVGPSGKEWIEGDPFLDACLCTTGCSCRKNQRVLYRTRHDGPQRDGRSDADSKHDDGDVYGSGEIRYILRDDLGRDCGDHSGCKRDKGKTSESSGSEAEDSKKKKSKKKKEKRKEEKKEEKKRKETFQGLKEDLLEALDSRFQDMNKASQHHRATSTTPPQLPRPFGGPGMGPSPFMMGVPHHMDPRIAQQLGMMGGDGYGMGKGMHGRMPPGTSDPSGKRGMQYPDGMGGAGITDFADGIPDMGPLGMGIPSPHAMPAGMQNHNAGMRRNFMSHCGARAGGPQRQFGGSMDMDPIAAISAAQAMAQGRGRGGGIMRGHKEELYSESDDFDFGPPGPSIRSSRIQRQHAAYDRPAGPRDRRRNSNESSSVPKSHKFGASPQRKPAGSQGRGKQPRVDTDDDEAC